MDNEHSPRRPGGLIHGDLTERIMDAAFEVHRTLGPGLMESVYEKCLQVELDSRKLAFRSQIVLPVTYKGATLDCQFRIDMLVEDLVVLELKSVESILPIHEAQLITYLRLSGKRVGFVLNFNVAYMKEGIMRRIV